MNDLETLLRATFATHEREAPNPPGLAGAARSQATRARRRRRFATAGTSVVVAVALLVGGVTVLGGSAKDRPATGLERLPVAAPAGWQVVSSLGVEVSVPPSWAINGTDDACTQAASVFRAQTISLGVLCSPNSELAVATITGYMAPNQARSGEPILASDGPRDVRVRQVVLQGLTATIGQGRMVDGRAFLTLGVPSIDVSVTAVGPDSAVIDRVVRSVRAVRVDNVGCSTALAPAPSWDRPAPGPRVSVGVPTSVAVCYYDDKSKLAASTRLTGTAATAVSRALNSAPAGVVDSALSCKSLGDVVIRLRLTYATGAPTDLIVHDPGDCGSWYVTAEHGVSQPSAQLFKAMLVPLRVGYALYPGIPGFGKG